MKRVWFAAAFLIIAAALCFAEQYYINEFYKNLSDKIETAQAYSKSDDERLDEALIEIKGYWEKHNDLIFALTNHGVLNDLSAEVHSLSSDTAEEGLGKTKAFLTAFYENQRITFSNIF